MNPGTGVHGLGRAHVSYKVKMHYFFKNLLLYFRAWIGQTMYIVMITKELRVFENYKVHDSRGRGSCARA